LEVAGTQKDRRNIRDNANGASQPLLNLAAFSPVYVTAII
jgi:hypothetical protein